MLLRRHDLTRKIVIRFSYFLFDWKSYFIQKFQKRKMFRPWELKRPFPEFSMFLVSFNFFTGIFTFILSLFFLYRIAATD